MSCSVKNYKKKASQNRHLCTVCIFETDAFLQCNLQLMNHLSSVSQARARARFSLTLLFTLLFTSLLSMHLDYTTHAGATTQFCPSPSRGHHPKPTPVLTVQASWR
mmetsp:Transcript_57561/g.84414  ORF Transcript_57561/g.84414 Transcript_57561/m.84414 type:complete len:106 (+) Transcript_57561:156-473(+)